MKQEPLIGVQACVFDAYGTLFDFAAAARGCRDVLGDSIDKLTALWRDCNIPGFAPCKAGTRISGRSLGTLSTSRCRRWPSNSRACAIA